MCRLFAYAHAGSDLTLSAALHPAVLDQYHALAEVHRDGWGLAGLGSDGRSLHLSSVSAARDAAVFRALTNRTFASCIIHERLASPGIDLNLDNQQPFAARGIAFGHNGTISNGEGNIVRRPPPYRESLGLLGCATMSDSRLYADLFLKELGEIAGAPNGASYDPEPAELVGALSAAIRLLRRDYPDASYNAIIQTPSFTAIVRAHTADPVYSEGLRRIYEKAGWADRIANYYAILYASFAAPDGSTTSVASSSGYPASDEWNELGNDRVLLMSNRDASLQVMTV